MKDKKVFALTSGGIGARMTLRYTPFTIEAVDSTGALIATAHHVNNRDGWVIVDPRTHEVLGTEVHKPEAELELRKIVGLRK